MKRMKNQQVQPTNYGAKLRATLLTLTLILGCVYATHQEKDALLKSDKPTLKVALRIDGKVVKTPVLLEDNEWDKPFSLSLLNAKTDAHYRYTGIEFFGKKGDAPFHLLGGTMQVEKNEVPLPPSINAKHYYDEIAIEVKGLEIQEKDGKWTTLPQSNAYFLIKKK